MSTQDQKVTQDEATPLWDFQLELLLDVRRKTAETQRLPTQDQFQATLDYLKKQEKFKSHGEAHAAFNLVQNFNKEYHEAVAKGLPPPHELVEASEAAQLANLRIETAEEAFELIPTLAPKFKDAAPLENLLQQIESHRGPQ